MKFGIIVLRSSDQPSSSEPSHAGQALDLLKQSRLKSNAHLAPFTSEATGIVQYGFDGRVQETSEQVLKMFDTALGNPVGLDLLLEELQTISVEASKGKVKSRFWFTKRRGTQANPG